MYHLPEESHFIKKDAKYDSELKDKNGFAKKLRDNFLG